MAETKKDEGKIPAGQTGKDNPKPDETAAALRASGVQPQADTASGIASRGEVDTPKHDHKGGAGASEINDTMLKPGKPTGAQTEPALFTANGSIPHAQIPSPTGLVPAAVAGEDAEQRLEDQRTAVANQGRTGRYRLSDDYAETLSPAQLRAVATDRGYDVGDGGRRVTRQRFLEAQAEDETLEDPPEGSPYALGTKKGKAK